MGARHITGVRHSRAGIEQIELRARLTQWHLVGLHTVFLSAKLVPISSSMVPFCALHECAAREATVTVNSTDLSRV